MCGSESYTTGSSNEKMNVGNTKGWSVNGDVNDYYALGYRNLYTTNLLDNEMLYIAENVYLMKKANISVFGESNADFCYGQ